MQLANQIDPQNPVATYTGGIGIDEGVALCTGLMSDDDGTPSAQRGLGVEGPNNGEPQVNAGEITTELIKPIDQDFDDFAFPTSSSDGGDATVLQFNFTVSSPGFIRISFVFGSDEYPAWINQQFNDSFAILLRKQGQTFTNLATLKEPGQSPKPFSLQDIASCGFPMFLQNDVAPAPGVLTSSLHHIDGADLYDHEFGGFTKKLTRETILPLTPGTYTLKIVVQDVGTNMSGNDMLVDSAVFIEKDSVKLFSLKQGDYNGDGVVNTADYAVWSTHFGQSPATFYDGDGNGDGVVNAADYILYRKFQGQTGNADLSADFNRDGCVDDDDWEIWNTYQGLDHCGSRFEGDADGDGDVDDIDEDIFNEQAGNCGEAFRGGGGEVNTLTSEQLPESPDMDNDGDVDQEDIAVLNQVILGAQGEPTPAE